MTTLTILICTHSQLFTNDFPCADIHKLLCGDILHQVIKGTFKDHLVTWIGEYLVLEHGEVKGHDILDEIDHQYIFLVHFTFSMLSSYQNCSCTPFSRTLTFPSRPRFQAMDRRRLEGAHEGARTTL